MVPVRNDTIHGGSRRRRYLALGVVAACLLSGCSAAPAARTTMLPTRPSDQHPAIVATTNNEPVRNAAAAELGPEAAAKIPPAERPAPQLVDRGAAAIVEAIAINLNPRESGSDGVTRISLTQIRNQSRSTPQEFAAFTARLAGLLNRAARQSTGDADRIEFTSDPSADSQYQVQGAAYVITMEGFDVWEMFLSMSPSSHPWTVWQAAGPIRVLRQPRPDQPQIVSW